MIDGWSLPSASNDLYRPIGQAFVKPRHERVEIGPRSEAQWRFEQICGRELLGDIEF
jgi:hypothetical protein